MGRSFVHSCWNKALSVIRICYLLFYPQRDTGVREMFQWALTFLGYLLGSYYKMEGLGEFSSLICYILMVSYFTSCLHDMSNYRLFSITTTLPPKQPRKGKKPRKPPDPFYKRCQRKCFRKAHKLR